VNFTFQLPNFSLFCCNFNPLDLRAWNRSWNLENYVLSAPFKGVDYWLSMGIWIPQTRGVHGLDMETIIFWWHFMTSKSFRKLPVSYNSKVGIHYPQLPYLLTRSTGFVNPPPANSAKSEKGCDSTTLTQGNWNAWDSSDFEDFHESFYFLFIGYPQLHQ